MSGSPDPVRRLKVEETACPNPAYTTGTFKIGDVEIGRAQKFQGGGWILPGGRKERSEREAALLMLRANLRDAQDRQAKAAADEQRARLLLRAMEKMI